MPQQKQGLTGSKEAFGASSSPITDHSSSISISRVSSSISQLIYSSVVVLLQSGSVGATSDSSVEFLAPMVGILLVTFLGSGFLSTFLGWLMLVTASIIHSLGFSSSPG